MFKHFLFTLLLLLIYSTTVVSRSLAEIICRKQPNMCDDDHHLKEHKSNSNTPDSTNLHQNVHLPTEFPSWNEYGKTHDDGTGYGSGFGPTYGAGLGDIAVRTGVGVQFPYGNFGYRRDFELGFGGSGRIGGMPIGFGNGYSANGADTDLTGWPHPRPFQNGDMWPMG